jgi:hypothetical protein
MASQVEREDLGNVVFCLLGMMLLNGVVDVPGLAFQTNVRTAM